MSAGNGKPGGLREQIAHGQAESERALAALAGSEWEDEDITANIEIPRGRVTITGKHEAVSAAVADALVEPKPPESVGPPSKASPITIVWLGVRRMPPTGIVIVALALVAAYVALHWGK